MLQINNTYTKNLDSINDLENMNHKDSFEYLPESKGLTYADILKEQEGGNFITIKIVSDNTPEDAESAKMIKLSQHFRPLAACSHIKENLATKGINGTKYHILSLSYKSTLEENASKKALLINALFVSERGEIPKTDLVQIAKMLAEGLGIKKYYPDKEEDEPLTNGIAEDPEPLDEEQILKHFSGKTSPKKSAELSSSVAPEILTEEKRTESTSADSLNSNNRKNDTELPNAFLENNDTSSTPFTMEAFQALLHKDENSDISDLRETDFQSHAEKAQNNLLLNQQGFDEQSESLSAPTESIEENIDDKEISADTSIQDADKKENTASKNDDIPLLNQSDHYVSNVDLTNKERFYELHDIDEKEKTIASKEKLDKCFATIMKYYSPINGNERVIAKQTLSGEISKEYFLKNVENFIRRDTLKMHVPVEDIPLLMRRIERAFFSYYILDAALNDPDITDIKITSARNFNVKVKGKHYTVKGIGFLNDEDYIAFLFGMLLRNKERMQSPIIVFTDTKFCEDYRLRFNVTLANINTSQLPVIHIRKVPKNKLSVEDLVRVGMMPQKVATYLKEQIRTAKGIVFAGPSASGKTNAMNAFVDEIPFEDSALCIQESDEIFSDKHPNFMCQHILKNPLGKVEIGLEELGRNGLLCDIKYFLIGEIKGAEARDFLRACNSGHVCMCTIHSPSSTETIPRFADYIKYGSDYSIEEAERMLKDLEIIVYIENFKVREISRIAGYDEINRKIIYKTIYRADLDKTANK